MDTRFASDEVVQVTAPVLAPDQAECTPSVSPLEEEVTELFDELRLPVLRYVSTLGLSPPDADEVAQEVFLSLFQHLRQGKPRQSIRGWVFRVAHNLALKQRHAKHAQCMVPLSWNEQHVDLDPTPEQQAANRQRQQRLLAIVRALPERDRCCLYLRGEGLRYREIAKVLRLSVGAVCISLQRSLARLSRADECGL